MSSSSSSSIFSAIRSGDIDELRSYLTESHITSVEAETGLTPVMLAAMEGQHHMLEVMCNAAPDIDLEVEDRVSRNDPHTTSLLCSSASSLSCSSIISDS